MRHMLITNKTKQSVLGERIGIADTFLSRLIGLMGRRSLGPNEGLFISPSSGVHTGWMRMSIDVVALDRANRVLKLGHSVKPWRFSCLSSKAARIVELPAGKILESRTEVGDLCELASS